MFSACSVKSFSTLMIFWTLKKKKKKKKLRANLVAKMQCKRASGNILLLLLFFFLGGGELALSLFFFFKCTMLWKIACLKIHFAFTSCCWNKFVFCHYQQFKKSNSWDNFFKIFNLLIESKIMQTHLNRKSVKFYVSTQLRKHLFLIGN